MSLAWIPFIMVTIFLFGIGQVFTKTGTARLGSPGMLLLLSINMFIIYGGAWLIFHENISLPLTAFLYCILAAALSAVGYIFFYEAVERQKISLVGVITAAYPFITAIMAVIFLHEPLTSTQIAGIILIIASVSLLAYSPHEYSIQKKTWLFFAVLCFIVWGIWAAAAKFAINLTGHITYTGVYALVGPLVWVPYWYARSGKFNITREDTHAELSLAFFCFGGLAFYAALHYGLASMVTAFSNLYPFITLIFARLILSETMERHHKIAVALALSGILIVTV
ncbi:MAG: DMT family transporter [Theionarchaea archaeon]|nr:DMT family transporter [Theionarchaea archaeon]